MLHTHNIKIGKVHQNEIVIAVWQFFFFHSFAIN